MIIYPNRREKYLDYARKVLIGCLLMATLPIWLVPYVMYALLNPKK